MPPGRLQPFFADLPGDGFHYENSSPLGSKIRIRDLVHGYHGEKQFIDDEVSIRILKLVSAAPPPSSVPPLAKWQEIFHQLEEQLAAGSFQSGGPFFTLEQLGREFSVSDITARRVFQELKGRGWIETRGRRGTFVLDRAQRQSVFLCLPSHDLQGSAFFRQFVSVFHRKRLDERFDLKPVAVDFCLRHPDVLAGAPVLVAMEALLRFEEEHVLVDHQRLEILRQHGQVIVFRSLLEAEAGVQHIGRDLQGGIAQAVLHLVERGHRHIGMLCGRLTNLWFKPRFEGFLEALTQAGLSCDPQLIEITSGSDPEEDYAAVERLLARTPRPTALVCASDGRALHVLSYCRTHGLSVPQDLAVTGFDNTLEASLVSPSLTSVDTGDTETVCRLFQWVEQGPNALAGASACQKVPTHLVVREST